MLLKMWRAGRNAKYTSVVPVEWDRLDRLEIRGKMDLLEWMDDPEHPDSLEPTPPPTMLSLAPKTSASSALLDPPESPETPDPRDSPEPLGHQASKDLLAVLELLAPPVLRDLPVKMGPTDNLDSPELLDKCALFPLLQVLPGSLASLELLDFLDTMDSPENQEIKDRLDLRESLEWTAPLEILDLQANPDSPERTDLKVSSGDRGSLSRRFSSPPSCKKCFGCARRRLIDGCPVREIRKKEKTIKF